MRLSDTEALYICLPLILLANCELVGGLPKAECWLERACESVAVTSQLPEEGLSLLQKEVAAAQRTKVDGRDTEPLARVSINYRTSGGAFERQGKEVLLLGGNYVLKAQPYYPDADIVRNDARAMAAGARKMKYKHPGKQILPCVRLGALFEGAMPKKGSGIDDQWARRLSAAVQAFASEGVYVFLDIHQDALSTTNGGEGLPWWIAAEMQRTSSKGEGPFIVTPEYPLDLLIPAWLSSLVGHLLPGFPTVKTAPEDKDPWRAFSAGHGDGNPAYMAVGNINMRLNNHDKAWEEGVVTWSRQVHNLAHRFFQSPYSEIDKRAFFDPYVAFVAHLCRVWEENSNVVAVELFNEPPMGGLPDRSKVAGARRDLFNFYSAVLKALDEMWPPIQAPVAIEDIGGALPESGLLMDMLSSVPLDMDALVQLSNWAWKGQLVLSFHYYRNVLTEVDFTRLIELAKKRSVQLGAGAGVPIFLSEFFNSTAKGTAEGLAQAAELGCNAATFWQYVNTEYTGTDGWFKYPQAVVAAGDPIDSSGNVNWKAWSLYEETVRNGTFWGAAITGGRGGKSGVLELIPDLHPDETMPNMNIIVFGVSIAVLTMITLCVCLVPRN
eukprot:TRINITY_DN36222_c0_g1_i1.p1 TRINITY_DN36222_c0_g1~~TRINITY_DN36222_c0_g1_i1.p1  ORF type:complete len:609 (+),score=100.11 TRINITY_DN36222_c0_g1_i1:62-1888(+)